MRKQPRSAAVFTAIFIAVGASLVTGSTFGPLAAHADEDRTNSPEYTESRADYWQARAAYFARKAATQARKAGAVSGEEEAAEAAGEAVSEGEAPLRPRVRGAQAAPAEPAAEAEEEPEWGPSAEQWAALRRCESGDDYGINTGNGYYGAYQFSPITWWWLGYQGYPHQAPPSVQDQAARELWGIYGWSPWPACSRYLGFL